MWVWIFVFCFLVLLAVIAITPVQVLIHYSRVGDNDHLLLEFSAWFRLIRRAYEIPVLNLEKSGKMPEVVAKVETVQQGKLAHETVKDFTQKQAKKWFQRTKEVLEMVHDLRPLMKEFFRQVRCTRLEWHTEMGTGQADETGALTGLIWGIKSMIIGTFSNMIALRTLPRLSVQPVWNQSLLHTQLDVKLRFYLGHLLLTGLRIFFRMKNKKRLLKWETTPTHA